jgi:hypothetical protein
VAEPKGWKEPVSSCGKRDAIFIQVGGVLHRCRGRPGGAVRHSRTDLARRSLPRLGGTSGNRNPRRGLCLPASRWPHCRTVGHPRRPDHASATAPITESLTQASAQWPVDDLGGGRAELVHPPCVKRASWFPGILGVDGAWARPTPEEYLRRERRRPLESVAGAARA